MTRRVSTFAPEAWQQLLSTREPAAVLTSPEGKLLADLLRGTGEDGHASQLKVFNSHRLPVYASSPGDIGVREENELLRKVLETGKPTICEGKTLYARLCSLAKIGEVVIDELALRRSGMDASGFSPAEKNKVKGRTATVTVRR